ncbi:MAG: DJ-1/PfpI family protein [Actinomycetota bacterium]|nr:DJ-1/PfpI family protein [Actinomycetota bacterium]
MEKILVLAGDAAEDLDAMYPIFRLREAGYEVHVAAPTRRKVKLVVHDFEEGWDAYTERPGRHLPVDLAFSEAEPEGYAALVIPGGRAPEYIRNDPDVARICTHFFEQNLPVGLVCHGVQVPAALGLLRGRTVSGFPPLKPDLEAAGAIFEEAPDVVDGNIVSCTGWPDLPEFSRAFIGVLERAAVSM